MNIIWEIKKLNNGGTKVKKSIELKKEETQMILTQVDWVSVHKAFVFGETNDKIIIFTSF